MIRHFVVFLGMASQPG